MKIINRNFLALTMLSCFAGKIEDNLKQSTDFVFTKFKTDSRLIEQLNSIGIKEASDLLKYLMQEGERVAGNVYIRKYLAAAALARVLVPSATTATTFEAEYKQIITSMEAELPQMDLVNYQEIFAEGKAVATGLSFEKYPPNDLSAVVLLLYHVADKDIALASGYRNAANFSPESENLLIVLRKHFQFLTQPDMRQLPGLAQKSAAAGSSSLHPAAACATQHHTQPLAQESGQGVHSGVRARSHDRFADGGSVAHNESRGCCGLSRVKTSSQMQRRTSVGVEMDEMSATVAVAAAAGGDTQSIAAQRNGDADSVVDSPNRGWSCCAGSAVKLPHRSHNGGARQDHRDDRTAAGDNASYISEQ